MIKNYALRILYMILGFTALAYVIFSARYNSLITEFGDTDVVSDVIIPDDVYKYGENETVFVFNISDDSAYSRSLQFMSSHQNVKVFCNEKLVFSRQNTSHSFFGKSPGTAINIIQLPVNPGEVKVFIEDPFSSDVPTIIFYYGNGLNMMSNIIKESIVPAIISLFILFCGVVMLVFWFISIKNYKLNPAIFYFGVFTTLLGCWSLNETDILMLLISDRMSCSIFGYLCLSLLIYPFLQFARNYLQMEKTKWFYIAVFSNFFVLVLLCTLHLLGIADFKQTAIIFHVLLLMTMVYVIGITIKQHARGIAVSKAVAIIIATLALLVSAGINMFSYYGGALQTKITGKIGILIFILALGIETMTDTFKQINEGKKADFYKNMALNDMMTGLLNRTAFEKWEYETTSFKEKGIVVFDLNELKKCNDTLGHSFGDMYIVEAANMIKSCFSPVGDCYRIGGDEFACVFSRKSLASIDFYISKLRSAEKKYNDTAEKLFISIAIGKSKFDPSCDKDFEDTRSRADKLMYEDKLRLKEYN